MIKITITIKELDGGTMSLTAEALPDSTARVAEVVAYVAVAEKVTQMVREMSEKASNSVYGEGENAEALFKIIEGKGKGKDGDQG